MTTVQLKKLRHDFGNVLKLIENGEEVLITKRGRAIARMLPPGLNKPKKIKRPDFAGRLKKRDTLGGMKGNPQKFWDEIRGNWP